MLFILYLLLDFYKMTGDQSIIDKKLERTCDTHIKTTADAHVIHNL